MDFELLFDFSLSMFIASCTEIAPNGLQLQEVGYFEAQNCLPAMNLIRSTKLHLTTESPISCRCCYMPFLSSQLIILSV